MKEYLSTFNRPELLDRLVLKEESFDLEKDIGKRKEVKENEIIFLFDHLIVDNVSRTCTIIRNTTWSKIG